MENLLDRLPAHSRVEVELLRLLADKPIGFKLMSEHELAKRFNVSRITLRKAAGSLMNQGILCKEQGRGTFLRRSMEVANRPRSQAKLLGVVVPTVENSMIARIVKGAEQAAINRGYHIILAHDRGNSDIQIRQLKQLLERKVDGLVAYPMSVNIQHPDYIEMLNRFVAQDIPLVVVDRYIANADIRCVMVDNYSGMYIATEHLILAGRRRFAFLGFGPNEDADPDRRKGFFNALHDYHILPTQYEADLGSGCHEAAAQKVVGEWVEKVGGGHLAFDAIVCMQDNMAYGAYMALKDAGYNVPQDVALVGFDNLDRELYRVQGLNLSSIDQPAEEIGTQAINMLIDQVEDKPIVGPKHVLLKPKLVVRTSCGSDQL